MMRRAFTLLGYDILFQVRHGFYLVYLIISAMYVAILFSVPGAHRLLVTNALVFSDTSVLGLTFVGALILLEKQQDILHSLFVTPVRLREYILAKTLSLSLLALLASLIILFIPNGLVPLPGLYVLGVLLGSSMFTLIGIGVGARTTSLNGFIFSVMAGTLIFSAPLLGYLGVYDAPWLFLLPTRATLLLLAASFQSISAGQALYALITLVLWNVAAWLFAAKSFRTYIIKG